MYRIMASVKHYTFPSSFPIGCLYLSPRPTALGSQDYAEHVVRVGVLVWFLILEEKRCSPPLSVISAKGVSHMVFIRLRYTLSIPILLGVLIINGWCILSNAVSTSIDEITWFLSFLLVWCVTLVDLHMSNHPCAPGMNPTWSGCIIFLMYCYIWFANILFEIFASGFIRDIGL